MTVVTLMWEARAAEGRGAELLEWARTRELPRRPLRRETFRAPGERVLVLTWWEAPGPDAAGPERTEQPEPAAELPELPVLPELPEPASELITRPVHRWRFESLDFPAGELDGPSRPS
ncbi:hypothetical protein [Streptomyces formicae]|uniref:ABM domain-containing protein n=1 Tax=Streptomyces formicae TaxID=1616117 RepID=A0ABY3WLS2_9ACTN|nr:hypothetical protein [Streptomyces formicae]UNM10793.1 hypothetical protein J4032_04035 [Streptomyces formicae]